MKRKLTNIMVTGGAGFIGCNFIHFMFSNESGFNGKIINVDSLTYAGNLESLASIEDKFGNACMTQNRRYYFENVDICNRDSIEKILKKYEIDTIVHFAAESHVDRSILGPETFIKTNVMGTFNLLDCARNYWKNNDGSIRNDVLFHHISTDEVYGSLEETGYFTETTPYDPRSPYSSSKASSDHLAMAYFHTYNLPVTLSNCSNNYGPYQFPEKLLPLMIMNIREGKNLPVYGDGKNIRDWLYVEDHNRAVWLIMKDGKKGEKYNIGGENEWENIKLLHKLIEITCKEISLNINDVKQTIQFVKDRPGHDRRYAIDCSKIKKELGWKRKVTFEEGLEKTVKWYLSNEKWINNILSGEYSKWIENNYGDRK
ncbi:MAG: dTDP-glucose 4,6-dehydratase [Treponema sp.]|nr:dTDP-glucose 4,6-dehydratase [Treponema sp.]